MGENWQNQTKNRNTRTVTALPIMLYFAKKSDIAGLCCRMIPNEII